MNGIASRQIHFTAENEKKNLLSRNFPVYWESTLYIFSFSILSANSPLQISHLLIKMAHSVVCRDKRNTFQKNAFDFWQPTHSSFKSLCFGALHSQKRAVLPPFRNSQHIHTYHIGGKAEVPLGSCLAHPLCLRTVRPPSMFYKVTSQGGEQIPSTALGASVCGWLWKGWLTSQRWWPFFFIVFYYSSEQKVLQLCFFISEAVYCPGLRRCTPPIEWGSRGDMQQTGQNGRFLSLHRHKEPHLGPSWAPNSDLQTNRAQHVLGWGASGRG